MNAATADAAAEEIEGPISSRVMTRIFFGFAVLAMLSLALSLVGKWFGSSIALAGYTDDPSPRQVVIGNNVLVAPANTIRFERARRDGIASRLDLYLRWPQLDGYSDQTRDDFNNVGNRRNILFLGLEERVMSRDMSGRFAPIYRSLIVMPGRRGPGGLTIYEFSKKSGYLNEILAVAARGTNTPTTSAPNTASLSAEPARTSAKSGPLWSSTMTSWIMVSSRCVAGSSTGTREFSASSSTKRLMPTSTRAGAASIQAAARGAPSTPPSERWPVATSGSSRTWASSAQGSRPSAADIASSRSRGSNGLSRMLRAAAC